MHGTDITLLGKDNSFKPVIEYAINKSDAVTAVSDDLRKETYSHFNIDKDIKMIPNFIDSTLYNKKQKDSFRKKFAAADEKIITHISNFQKGKKGRGRICQFLIKCTKK